MISYFSDFRGLLYITVKVGVDRRTWGYDADIIGEHNT